MSLIKLKSQWYLRHTDKGPLLLSETHQQPQQPALSSLLERLVTGINPADLDDGEFEQIEVLNSSGYLDTGDARDSFTWELQGASYSTVQDQFSHVSIKVWDRTYNGLGLAVVANCRELNPANNARLRLIFADSYEDLPLEPPTATPYLPIICNRMRLWLGPLHFPWTKQGIRERVLANPQHLPKPRYELEPTYDALQRAYLVAAIPQMIGLMKLEYVRCIVEFNMLTMRQRVWPL